MLFRESEKSLFSDVLQKLLTQFLSKVRNCVSNSEIIPKLLTAHLLFLFCRFPAFWAELVIQIISPFIAAFTFYGQCLSTGCAEILSPLGCLTAFRAFIPHIYISSLAVVSPLRFELFLSKVWSSPFSSR